MEKIDIHNTQTSYDQAITKIKENKKRRRRSGYYQRWVNSN